MTKKSLVDVTWDARYYGLTAPEMTPFYVVGAALTVGAFALSYYIHPLLGLPVLLIVVGVLWLLIANGIAHYREFASLAAEGLLGNWAAEGATEADRHAREDFIENNSLMTSLSYAGLAIPSLAISQSGAFLTPGNDFLVGGLQGGGSGLVAGAFNDATGQYVSTDQSINTTGNLMVGAVDITGHQYGTGSSFDNRF